MTAAAAVAAAVWWCERAARTTCRLPSLSHTLMHKCLNTNTSTPLGTPFYPPVKSYNHTPFSYTHVSSYTPVYLQSESLSVTPLMQDCILWREEGKVSTGKAFREGEGQG